MRRMEAIRRVEELTFENAELKKRIEELKSKIILKDEELHSRYVKIGNLICDNGRLIKANACLADMIGAKRARRKYDENGDYIPVKGNKE